MKYLLRRLNDDGVKAFSGYIQELRSGIYAPVPKGLLTDERFSGSVPWSVELEESEFGNRYELGEYLTGQMRECDLRQISHDVGLWSWLALMYFDQLCPADATGARRPKETYSYILSRDYNHHPRHSIRTTCMFVARYGRNVTFMFSKGLHERGEIVEQLAARQDFLSCEGIIGAARLLYDDPSRGTFKKGAAGKGGGSVRRFVNVLQQFDVTYDLVSLTAGELIGMLPKEFDRFREASMA